MNKLKIDMEAEATLIATFKKYGANITVEDIPQVLSIGVDTFLLRNQMQVPDKHLDEIYLILHEMWEQKAGASPN